MKMIKINDLWAAHSEEISDYMELVRSAIVESDFIGGQSVETFEHDFAKFNNSPHCCSCANGTDALIIAIKSMKITQGDEVIVPALSWISTASSVHLAGGTPVFCDVDIETGLINIEQIQSLITKKTVGIIPVHLFGQPVDMLAIQGIASHHKLWIIEDCAQAHGAKIGGINVGNFGDAATFSFYPGKNIGAFGDAGAIISATLETHLFCKAYANHGAISKGEFEMVGVNSRLDSIHARVLTQKIGKLKEVNNKRQLIANEYNQSLNNCDVRKLQFNNGSVYHQYPILVCERKKFRNYMYENGIETACHYDFALNKLPIWDRLDNNNCKHAEKFSKQTVSLPIHPKLTQNEQQYIIEVANDYSEH